MASFQAKRGWKRLTKRENKNCRSVSHHPTRNRKFEKKRRKFKKSKDTIVALFQAKISWKRPRNRENKNCRSVLFPPNA